MKGSLAWILLSVAVVALGPSTARAENDGNDRRALETAVVSPVLDGRAVWGGVATQPDGYAYGGYVYTFTHNNFLGNWRPSGLSLCPGSSRSEFKVVYRQRATATDIKKPFTLLGRVAPCADVTGDGTAGGGEGAAAVGGNGKFYVTSLAFADGCTNWNAGCFQTYWIGAVWDPNSTDYRFKPQPLLAISTVNGATFGFHKMILRSWDYDPAPPGSEFTRMQTPVGPATLWGYVSWGYISGQPVRWTRIQIAEHASQLKPSWATTYAYLLAADGTWTLANRLSGQLTKLPADVLSSTFGGKIPTTLFYDTNDASWYEVYQDGNYTLTPQSGCNEETGAFYNNPDGGEYHASWTYLNSTVARRKLGTSSPILYVNDTYTRNNVQIGAWLLRLGSQLFVLRGSTERICFDAPQRWWQSWIGSEITVEKLQ